MRIRDWVLVLLGVVLFGSRSEAQVIGVFTWQTQPFCNRVAITITQQGGLYQLTGLDDQCGAGSAPVYGTAVATATGVNLGFSVALGTGRTSHLAAVVSLATVSGTWGDGDGNVGTFAFNGTATGGGARPGPAALSALATIPSGVTVTGEYIFDGHQPSTIGLSDYFSVMLPAVAPAALTSQSVNFAAGIGAGDSDATCTGTLRAPTAPPGKVCIYASSWGGVQTSTLSGEVFYLPTKSFVVRFLPSGGGGDLFLYLTWAYTAP